jgi:hypothetical protein
MRPTTTIGQRYFPYVADICAGIAVVAARYRALAPLLVLVWCRLRRTVARLDRLAARWQQGRLSPRPGGTHSRQPPQLHPADAGRPRRTPQGHAWLIRLHQPLAQFAPRIQRLLDDPEVIALCAATPQAGRLLRPLCRMFAIAPPACIARPAPVRPRTPRPPKPQPPPFAEHSPGDWPFVPHRLRLRVPGLRRPEPPD